MNETKEKFLNLFKKDKDYKKYDDDNDEVIIFKWWINTYYAKT